MEPTFPILSIQPDWVLEPEQMGTKDKFWFRDPADPEERDWLFKIPTFGTGQHWAEKIAWEIAREIPITAPRVELAEFEEVRGSATLSFTRVRAGGNLVRYELSHGNQILAGMDAAYDSSRRFRQSQHTLERIFRSMEFFAGGRSADRWREQLAEYFVFDALIGNVDRHHENWGVLGRRVGQHWRWRLAPSFDHASALGRELQDDGGKQSRRRYLEELGVTTYIRRARGAVFFEGEAKHGPSPLDLVRRASVDPELGGFFVRAVDKVTNFEIESLTAALDRMPNGWLSSLEREFVFQLVAFNLRELQQLTP